MDVINKLAATVGPGHTVDLNDPELTIVAEVCQVSTISTKQVSNQDSFCGY